MKIYLNEDVISKTILWHFALFIKTDAPEELQMLNDALIGSGLAAVSMTINTVLWVMDNSDMNAELELINYIEKIIQQLADELNRLDLLECPIPKVFMQVASAELTTIALRTLY